MLHHVTTQPEWEAAQASGFLAPPSLAADGFIHLCRPDQLDGVRARHFAGIAGCVVLTLDPERLASPVRDEDLYGHGAFPHLYGPLPVAAVVAVRPLL